MPSFEYPKGYTDGVRLEYKDCGVVTCGFDGSRVGSSGDLILAGESVEDRSAADLTVGEVDHLCGLGFQEAGRRGFAARRTREQA